MIEFVALVVATWRLTHLVVYEDGVFDLFTRLRSIPFLAGLTQCFKCASVWCGGIVLFCQLAKLQVVVGILALSGLAILLWEVESVVLHPLRTHSE